jgi:hypothetical protein
MTWLESLPNDPQSISQFCWVFTGYFSVNLKETLGRSNISAKFQWVSPCFPTRLNKESSGSNWVFFD